MWAHIVERDRISKTSCEDFRQLAKSRHGGDIRESSGDESITGVSFPRMVEQKYRRSLWRAARTHCHDFMTGTVFVKLVNTH